VIYSKRRVEMDVFFVFVGGAGSPPLSRGWGGGGGAHLPI